MIVHLSYCPNTCFKIQSFRTPPSQRVLEHPARPRLFVYLPESCREVPCCQAVDATRVLCVMYGKLQKNKKITNQEINFLKILLVCLVTLL